MLEFHFLLEGSWPRGNIAPVLLAQPAGVAGANSLPEQRAARVGRKRFEDTLPDRRSSGKTPQLKNGKRRGYRNCDAGSGQGWYRAGGLPSRQAWRSDRDSLARRGILPAFSRGEIPYRPAHHAPDRRCRARPLRESRLNTGAL